MSWSACACAADQQSRSESTTSTCGSRRQSERAGSPRRNSTRVVSRMRRVRASAGGVARCWVMRIPICTSRLGALVTRPTTRGAIAVDPNPVVGVKDSLTGVSARHVTAHAARFRGHRTLRASRHSPMAVKADRLVTGQVSGWTRMGIVARGAGQRSLTLLVAPRLHQADRLEPDHPQIVGADQFATTALRMAMALPAKAKLTVGRPRSRPERHRRRRLARAGGRDMIAAGTVATLA